MPRIKTTVRRDQPRSSELSVRHRSANKELARARAAETMRRMRQDPDYRAKERERNAAAQRRNRMSDEYRLRERAKNAMSRAQARMDDEYRRKEREENAISMAILRQNEEYRRKERVRNARAMAQARANRKFEEAEAKVALKRNMINTNSLIHSDIISRRYGRRVTRQNGTLNT